MPRKYGLTEWTATKLAGTPDQALGSMLLFVLVIGFPVIIAGVVALPAPKSLGSHWYTLACGAVGGTLGVWLGALYTPTSKAEAHRFGTLQSFVLGLGGATIFALIRNELRDNLHAAVTNSAFAGPDVVFLLSTIVAGTMTVTARSPSADRAMSTE